MKKKFENLFHSLFLIDLSKTEKRMLIYSFFTGLFYSVMLVSIPFVISLILNVAESGSLFGLKFNIGFLIGFLILFTIFSLGGFLLHKMVMNKFTYSVKLSVESKVIEKVLESEKSHSKVMNIFTSDIPNLCETYYRGLFKILSSALFIVFGLVLASLISIYALLIELGFLLLSLFIQFLFKKIQGKRYDDLRVKKENMLKAITSYLNSKLTIKSNNAYDYAVKSVGNKISEKAKYGRKLEEAASISQLFISSVPLITSLFTAVIFAKLIFNGTVTGNNALAVIYVSGYLIWEVIKLVSILNNMSQIKSVREYILSLSNSDLENKKKIKVKTQTDIYLRNISVKLNNHEILKNVSVDFEQKKKYLILGKSGSGKTTLLNVIMNNIEYSGTCNVGMNMKLNYLPQNVELFPGSVSENVAVSEEFDEDEVFNAVEDANFTNADLSQFIDVEKETLSGGELKKVAFARALYHIKEYPVLIMDEPFEGLDFDSRKVIENKITDYNGTVLLISHICDNELLEKMDKVLIIEDGMVVYMGKSNDIPETIKQYYVRRNI